MWLSSASHSGSPVTQQGFKQPFNQRCPLLCEASDSLPARSLTRGETQSHKCSGWPYFYKDQQKNVPHTSLSANFHK